MTRTHYDPLSDMRTARARYFVLNRFGRDGGYEERWVAFKLGPLPVALPNTTQRVRAVRYHDLHHVLTGYHTDNLGEFEIAAWELGAGCRDYVAAWLLNAAALAAGSAVAPRRTFRAFVRGRACKSLYGEDLERLLESTVGSLRAETGLEDAEKARVRLADGVLYVALAGFGLLVGAGMLVLLLPLTPLVLLWSGLQRSAGSSPATRPE